MENTKKWNCTACGALFDFGDWFCKESGYPHAVDAKEYLILDTPEGRTIFTNIPPGPLPDNFRPGADDQFLGGIAEFIDGRFSTTDPEKQYWLDQRGGFISEDDWQRARPMTSEEKLKLEISDLQKEIAELKKEVAV